MATNWLYNVDLANIGVNQEFVQGIFSASVSCSNCLWDVHTYIHCMSSRPCLTPPDPSEGHVSWLWAPPSTPWHSLHMFDLSDHRILEIDLISPDSYFHQLVEPLNHYCLDSTQASCMKHLPVLGKVWEGSQWRHLGDPSSALSDESWISHMRDTHHEGTGTDTGQCDKKCPQRSLTRMKRSTKNVCLLTEPPEGFWL